MAFNAMAFAMASTSNSAGVPVNPDEEQKLIAEIMQLTKEKILQISEEVEEPPAPDAKKDTITIVLLGITGSGKSSSGNTVLSQNVFPTGTGMNRKTVQPKMETTSIFLGNIEYEIHVIDTQGFFDINPLGNEEIKKLNDVIIDMESRGVNDESKKRKEDELKKKQADQRELRQTELEESIKVFMKKAPGISAFFVVVNATQHVTSGCDLEQMLPILSNLFGGVQFRKRAFLLLTHLDEIEVTEEEFMAEEVPTFVKDFVDKIGGRRIFINNKLFKMPNAESETLMFRQSLLQRVLDNLIMQQIQPYGRWLSQVPHLNEQQVCLDEAINNLREACNQVEKNVTEAWVKYSGHHRKILGASTAGAAFSLGVGLPFTIAGLTLAVPTFGISLILTGIGASISIAGGLTAGGASIVDIFKKRDATSIVNLKNKNKKKLS